MVILLLSPAKVRAAHQKQYGVSALVGACSRAARTLDVTQCFIRVGCDPVKEQCFRVSLSTHTTYPHHTTPTSHTGQPHRANARHLSLKCFTIWACCDPYSGTPLLQNAPGFFSSVSWKPSAVSTTGSRWSNQILFWLGDHDRIQLHLHPIW